jgi:glyoxylase-like metal-dependent hydrolase (beta-lactamase superfamily II)
MAIHTDFRFHPQMVQIGCHWGNFGAHTELYLLEGDILALVDTGCRGNPAQYVVPALAMMGRTLRDVDVIINTHGHYDHVGGNAEVIEVSGAQVWLPELEVEVATDLHRQFDLQVAQNDLLVGREDRLPASLAEIMSLADATRVDRALKPREVLDLGRGVVLTVVPSPGHTAGSVCFYWEREGVLISGDAITGTGGRPNGLPLTWASEFYEETLDFLATLDISVLCQSHHYIPLSPARESVKYGAAAKQHIRESKEIARIITDGVEKAVAERPGAPFLEMAHLALAHIGQRLPLTLNPETGLPIAGATASLYSNWKQVLAR